MSQRKTTQEFIEEACAIHGNKYNYSKVNYINRKTTVCIICPEHGEFWQTPDKHIHSKHGCPKCCKNGVKYTTEEWIRKAKDKQGERYGYSKVNYVNSHTKVCIICPVHGEFWQMPYTHLNGVKCPKCDGKNQTTEDFIEKARSVHGSKYDYSKTEYVNNHTKVCIICPKHGEFWQTPHFHLSNGGCPVCNESHLEREIRIMLHTNSINFIAEKKFEWLKYKSLLKLDFYLPDYNIAIECQGLQHFKPCSFGSKKNKRELCHIFNETKKRDEIKNKLCKEHDITILYYSNLHIKYPYEVFEDKRALLDNLNVFNNLNL